MYIHYYTIHIMKRNMANIFKLAFFTLVISFSTSYFAVAQEINEEMKNEQEEVLKENPKDFGANYVVGAYYYNMAVDPHEETTKMTLTEYLEDGKPYEEKKEGFLKKALPYFENAYAINKNEPHVKQTLKKIYMELGMIKKYRATSEEINKQFEAKLSTIEFKKIE